MFMGHYYLVLFIPKVGTHFTIPQRVDLGTAVKVCSLYSRLYITVVITIGILRSQAPQSGMFHWTTAT